MGNARFRRFLGKSENNQLILDCNIIILYTLTVCLLDIFLILVASRILCICCDVGLVFVLY